MIRAADLLRERSDILMHSIYIVMKLKRVRCQGGAQERENIDSARACREQSEAVSW